MKLLFPDLSRMPAVQQSGISPVVPQKLDDAIAKFHTLAAGSVWGAEPDNNVHVEALGHRWMIQGNVFAGCYLLERPERGIATDQNDTYSRHYAIFVQSTGSNGLYNMAGTVAWVDFVPHGISEEVWESYEISVYAGLFLLGELRQANREREDMKRKNAAKLSEVSSTEK